MAEHITDGDCWCNPEVIVVEGPDYPVTIMIERDHG